MGRISNLWVLAGLVLLAVSFCDLHVSADVIPSENECRPYIEKAIHELKSADSTVTDDKDSNESTAGDDGSIEGDKSDETQENQIEETAGDDDNNSKESSNEQVDTNSSDENKTQEEQIDGTPESSNDSDGADSKQQPDGDSAEETGSGDGNSNESGPEAGANDDNDSQEKPTKDGNDGSVEGDETPEAGTEDNSEENATQEDQAEETASLEGEQDDGKSNESGEQAAGDDDNDSKEGGSDGVDSKENETAENQTDDDNSGENTTQEQQAASAEDGEQKDADSNENSNEQVDNDSKENDTAENQTDDDNSQENALKDDSKENDSEPADDDNDSKQTEENQGPGAEASSGSDEKSVEQTDGDSMQEDGNDVQVDKESKQDDADSNENDSKENDENSKENQTDDDNSKENVSQDADDSKENNSATDDGDDSKQTEDDTNDGDDNDSKQEDVDSKETDADDSKENTAENDDEASEEKVRSKRSIPDEVQPSEGDSAQADDGNSQENTVEDAEEGDNDSDEGTDDEETDEDDLTIEFEIPKNLRPHGHVNELLGLNVESTIKESSEAILKELKKIFDNAIKPLETMYKYRDLSNRHFGDPEIFSKPLVLFMGPYSGGKSTILNYLTENEYTQNSIRSGAEPSPAYFNILMHGEQPEVLDGTQLAADWTFSGLQKFGQGLMDRLRGQKLPNKLLERVNIVEIPGILEVRKQVSRHFPFNDACQWFIDRADIIFLVYDPSKLDVGPETEAILDQLKGREYQTRILLNKADQVKPEELLRVQGALIWNISPLMASAQPPVMYTVSLWSHPFESGAPIRLLQAQERAFLVDLREAIDKRIENKIASARRFAVRIRNHAKMVDCYLTTYYNQKGLFSNKKQVSDKIIENPQTFNIYEGLSTLTNISRYDLPDPEVYLDFFRLNPLYEFRKLSETCTYFKGCPINKLDIAIAYELPELARKYKTLH